jgi:DNA ligase-1
MKDFAHLFTLIDQTTKTNAKVAALADYFRQAEDMDKLWTIALFSGRRPKRGISTTLLRTWAAEVADVPLWLFEESYAIVGDLAETIALVLPEAKNTNSQTLTHWITVVKSATTLDEDAKKELVFDAWRNLGSTERFLFNKLLTGGFRIGVSQKLMTRALAQATGIEEAELQHKLMGDWSPDTTTFQSLVLSNDPTSDLSKPYPFYLAYQLEDALEDLDQTEDWFAEYKWDGIRGQLICREGHHFLWSRGEELMTDRFPEFACIRDFLPEGVVLDGEVLAWVQDAPLPFNALQKRIGRKTIPKKLLREAPVILYAYDLLEEGGQDLREAPLSHRRQQLAQIVEGLPPKMPIKMSPSLEFETWDHLAKLREHARERGAEGLMLKRKDAPYRVGRKKGDWWKWKVDPLVIDAVMIYAQAGHGRRANLFTDFTFAVWDGDDLVPFTKAYSGLKDEEFRQITTWVRKNTLQRFGPVRQVTPHHVFEIAFEGIQESPRHKSGVALRFPRMSRWRTDKPMSEANTLADLKAMLEAFG